MLLVTTKGWFQLNNIIIMKQNKAKIQQILEITALPSTQFDVIQPLHKPQSNYSPIPSTAQLLRFPMKTGG